MWSIDPFFLRSSHPCGCGGFWCVRVSAYHKAGISASLVVTYSTRFPCAMESFGGHNYLLHNTNIKGLVDGLVIACLGGAGGNWFCDDIITTPSSRILAPHRGIWVAGVDVGVVGVPAWQVVVLLPRVPLAGLAGFIVFRALILVGADYITHRRHLHRDTRHYFHTLSAPLLRVAVVPRIHPLLV